MKLTSLTTLSCLIALGACSGTRIASEYCDIATPFYIDNEETIDYLVVDEPQFVRDVLAHNEIHAEVCN